MEIFDSEILADCSKNHQSAKENSPPKFQPYGMSNSGGAVQCVYIQYIHQCLCSVVGGEAYIYALFCSQDMVHIADTKVARRYGDFFIRQIHKLNASLGASASVSGSRPMLAWATAEQTMASVYVFDCLKL